MTERPSLLPGDASLAQVTSSHTKANDDLEKSVGHIALPPPSLGSGRRFPHAETIVYVAGRFSAPDRAGVEANIASAVKVGIQVAQLGACPLVPHANTSHPEYESCQPYEFWIESTMALLKCSDALITVDGWSTSSGARKEVAWAKSVGTPVFHDVGELSEWLRKKARNA